MSQSGENKRNKSANLPVLCRERIGICTITLTLSSKRGSGLGRALPLCLRYSINGRRFYYDKNFNIIDDGDGGSDEEKIMLPLRLSKGIEKSLISKPYAHFIEAGLMRESESRITLTP